MPFGAGNLPVVAYAREHLLAPGGVLIPERDVLMAAIVSNTSVHERAVGRARLGATSLTAMRTRLSNRIHRDRTRSVRPSDLMAPGATWGTLEYATVLPRPVHGHADWRIAREGTGHGLLLWFDAVLAGGRGFSTAPGFDVVYPQLFLPWTEPVLLHQGDAVAVDLWAQPEGESWGWNTEIAGPDGAKRAQYKQSTFLADVMPLKSNRRTIGDEGGPS
jgi:protein arginine N-methyltransferase 1